VLTRTPICTVSDLYPTYHPAGGVKLLEEKWNLLSDDVKTILRNAESNLNALNTVDFGPKRPFSVGECALCAQMINSIFYQYFTLKMNSNDKMMCGNIANKQKINVLKWPFKFDWSRSSPKTSTSSPIWVIGISFFSISAVFEISSAGARQSLCCVCLRILN
jgi:hypothetical protein